MYYLGDASDYKKLEEANENERKTAKIMQRTLVVILPTVHFFSPNNFDTLTNFAFLKKYSFCNF